MKRPFSHNKLECWLHFHPSLTFVDKAYTLEAQTSNFVFSYVENICQWQKPLIHNKLECLLKFHPSLTFVDKAYTSEAQNSNFVFSYVESIYLSMTKTLKPQ